MPLTGINIRCALSNLHCYCTGRAPCLVLPILGWAHDLPHLVKDKQWMLVNDAAALGGVPLVAVSSTLKNFTVLSTPLNDHFFPQEFFVVDFQKRTPFSHQKWRIGSLLLSLCHCILKSVRHWGNQVTSFYQGFYCVLWVWELVMVWSADEFQRLTSQIWTLAMWVRRNGTLQHFLHAQTLYCYTNVGVACLWWTKWEEYNCCLEAGSLTTMALGSARSMVTPKDSVLLQIYFIITFPMPWLASPSEAAGCGCSSATDNWPGKIHAPLSEGGTASVARHFWRCFPIQWLPPACAVFSAFPMTSLCLSDHLTLETNCNGNIYKRYQLHISQV